MLQLCHTFLAYHGGLFVGVIKDARLDSGEPASRCVVWWDYHQQHRKFVDLSGCKYQSVLLAPLLSNQPLYSG